MNAPLLPASPACRVLLLSAVGTRTNPYIGLLEDGLSAAGAEVRRVEQLDPVLLSGSRCPDVIHLHWLDRYDLPRPIQFLGLCGARDLPRRALRRGLEAVANLAAIYQVRRWRRLRRLLGQLHDFRMAGGRLVYTVHNLEAHEGEGLADRWGTARLLALADIVHVHDAITGQELAARFGRREGIAVIPHGHYLHSYPNTVTRSEARRRLGLPQESFIYLTLGLLRPYKGIEELLPAFRSLPDRDIVLLLAGRPNPSNYVNTLAALTAGDDRVRLVPEFVPGEDLQIYFNASDICVLPYRKITTSGAALLAFSFGTPILAPAIGAFPDLASGPRGILYEPARPAALARALAQARQSNWPDRRSAIREWVQQFAWDQIGRSFLGVYRKP